MVSGEFVLTHRQAKHISFNEGGTLINMCIYNIIYINIFMERWSRLFISVVFAGREHSRCAVEVGSRVSAFQVQRKMGNLVDPVFSCY